MGIAINGGEHPLTAEDVQLVLQPLEGYQVERSGTHAVALNLELDGDLKREVADAYVAMAEPFRERVRALVADTGMLDDILAEGAARARKQACGVLEMVFDRVGLVPGRH